MKRTDAILKLADRINLHQNDSKNYHELAAELLDVLEDCGMIPPRYVITENIGPNVTRTFVRNEWEKEDLPIGEVNFNEICNKIMETHKDTFRKLAENGD